MRARHQTGYVYEASGAFFVRYYVTEIIEGQPKRVQKSQRLCAKDDKHFSTSCKPVRALRDEAMKPVNAGQVQDAATNDITVVAFWEKGVPDKDGEDHSYLKFITDNLKPSTVHGYKQIWGDGCECSDANCGHLKKHFGDTAMKDYTTPQATKFLTSLSKKFGRNTISHIRSLASGIFAHAVATGVIESNPWHDAKVLGKTKAPGKTKHYTLPEALAVINALLGRIDCQLIVALACFLGLRPGEISGLRWEDIDTVPGEAGRRWVHISRSVARNVVGDTKTAGSAASLPLYAPLPLLLDEWRRQSGDKREGWVFPNGNGKPVDLRSVVQRTIIPTLEAKGVTWKTLYAGRRGASTLLTELTGNALAAKELLRHKNIRVTEGHYVKALPESLKNGMEKLEAKVLNSGIKMLTDASEAQEGEQSDDLVTAALAAGKSE